MVRNERVLSMPFVSVCVLDGILKEDEVEEL